jgi:hypothetical protein
MTDAERKARREDGRRKELAQMSVAKKVQRYLTGRRPAAAELKTPFAALTAAKTLQREIDAELADGGDFFAVTIGYVSPDLSVLGFTPSYAPGAEDRIERALSGNIAIGLIFGIADGGEILMGVRPFLAEARQSEGWLLELSTVVQSEFEIERRERRATVKETESNHGPY